MKPLKQEVADQVKHLSKKGETFSQKVPTYKCNEAAKPGSSVSWQIGIATSATGGGRKFFP
jgi:hypothetical protein